ncbi:MAG: RCC1 domain-containing protein [Thermomicrobiales bacterium]
MAVAAGGDHALALDRGGQIWAWGRNDLGQLGDNAPLSRTLPALTRKEGYWWATRHLLAALAAGGGRPAGAR